MAFITRVRMEGAGESPDAIMAVFEETTSALEEFLQERAQLAEARVTDEVFERVGAESPVGRGWHKGRRVVWFVEPGGANDPNAGKP